MGERLVPEREVIQCRKERQMWQKRHMKSLEEVARLKAQSEELSNSLEQKELLLKKAIAHKGVNRSTETLRASQRAYIAKLQEELKSTTQLLSESQRQLGIYRHIHRQEKERSISPLPKQAVTHPPSEPPLTPLLSKAASMFLGGTTAGPSRQASQLTPIQTPRREPSKGEKSDEKILVTARTMLSPAKSPRGPIELPPRLEKRRDSDVISVKSRTLRSPSRSLSPAPSGRLTVTPAVEGPPLIPSRPPSKADSVKSGASFLLGLPKRGISTTVKESEFQTPLAREVSAYEKLHEAGTIRPPTHTASNVLLKASEGTPKLPIIEIPYGQAPPSLSIPVTPTVSVAATSPPDIGGGAPPSSTLVPTPSPPETVIVPPTEETVFQFTQGAEQQGSIDRKASAASFLGGPAIGRKKSEGRKIGGRKTQLEAASTPATPAESDVGRSRSGLGIGLGRRGPPPLKDTELDKEKVRSFFGGGDTQHKASPLEVSPMPTPRAQPQLDLAAAPVLPSSILLSAFSPQQASISLPVLDNVTNASASPHPPTLTEIRVQLETLLESVTPDPSGSSLVRELNSSDLSTVLQLLESLPTSF